MSLPSYPEYRASGVEWLGPIPTHWKTDRLKRRCGVFPSNVDKKSVEGEASVRLCNYTDVYYHDRIGPDMSFMEATASDDQISKFTLRAGDTIFTKDSETADDIGIASNVPADMPGVVCGYHLSIARPLPNAQAHGAYVKRLFDTHYTKARFAVLANGLTRVGLNQYAVDNIELPWPPLEEQVSIASFLDRETAKIDALIAEQEKLLALLAEKRQATISHAVTRGLNPNAPMKDSGIPWLGEVPSHWELRHLKTLSAFTTSGPRGWAEHISENGSLFIQSGDLNDDLGVDFYSAKRVTVGNDAEAARTRLFDGDLVICITGAKTGNVAVCGLVPEPAFVNQHLCLVRPNEDVDSRFLGLALKSEIGKTQLDLSQYGLKQGLSLENIRELLIALPPRAEQEVIVSHIGTEVHRLLALRKGAEQAIELLKERRSALISAAVTGKIDVRDVA